MSSTVAEETAEEPQKQLSFPATPYFSEMKTAEVCLVTQIFMHYSVNGRLLKMQ